MGNANINRGKKWTEARAKAVYENRPKDVEWIDSLESVKNDIKEYEDSLKTVEESPKEETPKEETKSKKGK